MRAAAGRKLRTHLDLLRPDVQRMVGHRQQVQKQQHDRTARVRSFEVGENVRVRDVVAAAWRPATISATTGPTSYECRLPDSRVVRRHVDHVIAAPLREEKDRDERDAEAAAAVSVAEETSGGHEPATAKETCTLRRSSRVSKPPERLSYV